MCALILVGSLVQQQADCARCFDLNSTFGVQHYVPWPLPKQEPARVPPRQNVPFEGTSTEHDTYKQWELPRPQLREAESRVSLPFEGDSKYHEDFAPKGPARGPTAGQKTPLADAKPAPGSNAPFDGHTTTGDYYKRWDLPKQEPARSVPRQNVPFEGTSTEHDTYKQWELPRPQLREAESRVSLPFEGDSKYHEDFAPKGPARGPTAGQKTPLADAKPAPGSNAPFDDHTTNVDVCIYLFFLCQIMLGWHSELERTGAPELGSRHCIAGTLD